LFIYNRQRKYIVDVVTIQDLLQVGLNIPIVLILSLNTSFFIYISPPITLIILLFFFLSLVRDTLERKNWWKRKENMCNFQYTCKCMYMWIHQTNEERI